MRRRDFVVTPHHHGNIQLEGLLNLAGREKEEFAGALLKLEHHMQLEVAEALIFNIRYVLCTLSEGEGVYWYEGGEKEIYMWPAGTRCGAKACNPHFHRKPESGHFYRHPFSLLPFPVPPTQNTQ